MRTIRLAEWLSPLRRALPILWLGAAYLVAFLAMLREPIASDDCSYFETAAGVFEGYQNAHRMGLVLPVRLAYWMFGYNAAAYYAVPFVSGLGLICCLYFVGRRYAPPIVAAMAATAFLANPDFLHSFTLLLPDVPSLFWFTFGALFLLRALEPASPFDEKLAPVLAGAGLFVSWANKESAVLQFLALPLALLFVERTPRVWRAAGLTAATAAGLLVLECLAYALTEGDALYRYHAVTGHHVRGARKGWVKSGLVADDLGWWDMAWRFMSPEQHRSAASYAKRTLLGINYLTLMWSSLAAAVLALWIHRQRRLGLLLGFAVASWAAISFSAVKLDPIVPLLRNKPRYFFGVLSWVIMFSVLSGYYLYVWARGRIANPRIQRMLGATLLVGSASLILYFAAKSVLRRSLLRDGNQPAFVARRMVLELAEAGTPVRRAYGDEAIRAFRIILPESLLSPERFQEVAHPATMGDAAGTLLLLPPGTPVEGSLNVIWAFSSPALEPQVYAAVGVRARQTFTPHGLRILSVPGSRLRQLKGGARAKIDFTAAIEPDSVQSVVLTLGDAAGRLRKYRAAASLRGSQLNVRGVTPPLSPTAKLAVTLDVIFKRPTHLRELRRQVELLHGEQAPRAAPALVLEALQEPG